MYSQNVSPGMKLWGVISEVNEKDIVVSLPGGLRGLVRASEALDTFVDKEVKGVWCFFFIIMSIFIIYIWSYLKWKKSVIVISLREKIKINSYRFYQLDNHARCITTHRNVQPINASGMNKWLMKLVSVASLFPEGLVCVIQSNSSYVLNAGGWG